MILCPMPGYDYNFLVENGFAEFTGYITGILDLHRLNRKGKCRTFFRIFIILAIFSSQENVMNFNGSKNINPVILSSKIKKIKNIDQILAKLMVIYITNEGKLEIENIEGKNLRDRSSLFLTPEGFCFNLKDVVKDQVPLNMKFYFIKSDDDALYGVKIKAEPRKKKILKMKLKPFSTMGDNVFIRFSDEPHQSKYSFTVNKEKVVQISANIQSKAAILLIKVVSFKEGFVVIFLTFCSV